VRRLPALTAAVLALGALSAPPALADSIVYEKDGNIWEAAPDGTGQRQITTTGGYSKPTQADDGTIVAVKDSLLQRMDRNGTVLNLAGSSGSYPLNGPITPALNPDGSLVAYNYNNTGPSAPGLHTSISYSTRETTHDEIYEISGRSNPSWIDNDRVLMFARSATTTQDTLIHTLGVPGTVQWYEDPELTLTGGEIDASQTRFAATDTARIRLYRLNAPPPAIAVEPVCDLTGPNGSFFRPTWSPSGAQLAWQEDDGIWVGTPNFANCAAATASLVVPGGKAPDWGPAAVTPTSGVNPGTIVLPLTAKIPKRIRLAALLRGMKVKVSCTCTATAKLLLAKRTIGKAKKAVAGSATLKLKPTRAGKARLRRGGKSVSVRVSGGGKTVTRKVKIVR
jgi:hypothetical protein